MKWKHALLGYREKDVARYIRDLDETGAEELRLCREELRAALETGSRLDVALEALRKGVSQRRARLRKTEAALIRIYYDALRTQIAAGKAGETGGAGEEGAPRGELWEMEKQRILPVGFWGVAPEGLNAYLREREEKHGKEMAALAGELSRLERSIVSQKEEIRALEELLAKPEMQQPFIGLAERFLARFERILEEALRGPAGGAAGAGASTGKAALYAVRVGRGEEAGEAKEDREDREEEEKFRQEKEMRRQISRCRQKLNDLLDAYARQKEAGVAAVRAPGENAVSGEGTGTGEGAISGESAVSGEGAGTDEGVALAVGSDAGSASGFCPAAGGATPVDYTPGPTGKNRKKAPDTACPEREVWAWDGKAEQGTEAERMPGSSLRFHYLSEKTAGRDFIGADGELLLRKGQAISPAAAAEICRRGLMERLMWEMNEDIRR